MAYDKYTWTTGETITAEKLNHMEDGIAEGGGGDCGFECSESETVYFEGDVIVSEVDYSGHTQIEGTFTLSSNIPTLPTLDIELNGEKLTLPKVYQYEQVTVYSVSEPSYIAINIYSEQSNATLTTTETGTYSLKIADTSSIPSYSECFESAVSDIIARKSQTFIPKFSVQQTGADTYQLSCDMTYSEIQDEMDNGKSPIPLLEGKTGLFSGRGTAGVEGFVYVFTFCTPPPLSATETSLEVEICTVSQFSMKYTKKTITLS